MSWHYVDETTVRWIKKFDFYCITFPPLGACLHMIRKKNLDVLHTMFLKVENCAQTKQVLR